MKKTRVRFAPSPTGHLHIGGLRTAIFNWLYARHTGGTFTLRVEDTDVQRSTKAYLESQLASLKWMGLEPDESLVYQMSRNAEHKNVIQTLLEKKLAYPCFCQARKAEDVVAQLEEGIGQKYDGTCRNKAWTQEDLKQPHAIRFKLPDDTETLTFQDAIRGTITVQTDQLDDFVIMRQDSTPTYNFCVVVDDIFMNITHVIRGEDHISNTFKQLVIYQALEAPAPVFAHIPLVLGKSGNKLSKRDAAVSVEQYRQNGYMPEALFNYLVRLGWSHGDQEVFTIDEMVKHFSLDGVGKKGSIFDTQKLEWLNGVYIRQATTERLLECIEMMDKGSIEKLNQAWDNAALQKLFALYQQRATLLTTLVDDICALAQDPASCDISLIAKWHSENTAKMLNAFVQALQATDSLEKEVVLGVAKEICTQHGEKLVALAQPLRLALTGTIQSPGVFDLILILGKESVVKRIEKLLREV